VSLREPRRNLQIQSTAPLNVSGSHFRTRRAKPQRPLCPDETCMEVTALKDQAETCRHFADRTIAERGVRYGRVATTPTSAKTKRHPKAYLAIETPVVACPLRVRSGPHAVALTMSALLLKADVRGLPLSGSQSAPRSNPLPPAASAAA
jgi:NikR C terminal nickel binding domain